MNCKRIKCVALAATLSLTGVLTNGLDAYASGKWEETEDGWAYIYDDGTYANSMFYEVFIDGWRLYAGVRTGNQCSWNQDSKGWWYGDSEGWYVQDTIASIDGKLCSFDSDGYLISGWKKDETGWRYFFSEDLPDYIVTSDGYAYGSQWIDGYWLDSDGYQRYEPRAQWYKDNKGWYYMDSSGYYERDTTVIIDDYIYRFDKDGYLMQSTSIEINYMTKTILTFEVDTKDKKKANKQLNDYLSRLVEKGKSEECSINGIKKKISNKDGKIFIGNDSLLKYINKNSKIEIRLVANGQEIDEKLFSIDLGVIGNYDYKVTFGEVTFSDIVCDGVQTSFKVNGKTYLRNMSSGDFTIEGDVRNEEWVRFLVGEGIFSDFGHLIY